jgi:CubicO group peptidase (beta-lactamase class C family)
MEFKMSFKCFLFKINLIKLLGFLSILSLIVGCGGNDERTQQFDGEKTQQFNDGVSLEENVDNYINALVSSNSPGIAIGVINQNGLLLSKGYGLANREKQTPISTTSPVYLASVSKQFFSMAIILLEHQGLLSFDDNVSQYFSEFPSSWENITIHQLLSHQSGLPDYFGYLAGDDLTDITNTQVLEWAVQKNLDFTPGSKFSYSNTGYIILSMLIERVSQTPINIFMENNIFAAAGMSNTLIYDETKPDISDRAIGYSKDGNLLDYNILTTGDGGIFSTVEDLLLWSSAIDNYSIVDQSIFESAITPYRNYYGYGWIITTFNNERLIKHSGGLSGFQTLIIKQQSTGLTVVMLSNGEFNWLSDLSSKILLFLQ